MAQWNTAGLNLNDQTGILLEVVGFGIVRLLRGPLGGVTTVLTHTPLVAPMDTRRRATGAILLLNADSPVKFSSLELQCWLFYNMNCIRTAEAIEKKTQRLLQERRLQAAMICDDHDDNAQELNAELSDDAMDDGGHDELGDSCAICLNTSAQDPFVLGCQHKFCKACLQRWLAQDRHTCPTCRTRVQPEVRKLLLQNDNVSMPYIFDLGRRLATNDMQALGGDMRACMKSLHANAQLHPFSALLSEASHTVLHAIGLHAADLTFKPYLEHMKAPTAHGAARSLGMRITALCAINANGLNVQQIAVDADACSSIRDPYYPPTPFK